MSDYTKTTDFVAKDSANATVLGSLWDTEYDAIETAIASKTNKIASPALDKLVYTDASSNLYSTGKSKVLIPVKLARASVGTSDTVSQSLSGTVEGIDICWDSLSSSGANEARILLGSSGSLERSGYKFAVGANGAVNYKASAIGWSLLPSTDGGQNSFGWARIRPLGGGNVWLATWGTWDSQGNPTAPAPRVAWGCGKITLPGACNVVGIGTYLYDNLDSGYWQVTYWRSA